MKFYLELPQLPDPPGKLLKLLGKPTIIQDKGRRNYLRDRKYIPTSEYEFYNIHRDNKPLYDWIQENIFPVYSDTKVMMHDTYGSPINGPHTDSSRLMALNYYIRPGGKNVETVWWQETKQPIRRPQNTFPLHYSDLKELERTTCKMGTWYLLNTAVVHSVENMTSNRTYISLSLNETDKAAIERSLDLKIFDWFNSSTK